MGGRGQEEPYRGYCSLNVVHKDLEMGYYYFCFDQGRAGLHCCACSCKVKGRTGGYAIRKDR